MRLNVGIQIWGFGDGIKFGFYLEGREKEIKMVFVFDFWVKYYVMLSSDEVEYYYI